MGADLRRGSALIQRWAADDGVARVLVVTAHPDDVDFGAAGTVAAFTDAGLEVSYCVVTDGDAGDDDLGVERAELAATRRAEQRAAAAEVGVRDVWFLGYPDGRVAPTFELRRDLSRVIRRVRPERVLAPFPDRDWDRIFASHPDHLAVGEAATCAVYPDARNPHAHPELLAGGFEPHKVAELWLMAAPVTSVAVDTTGTFERKIAALRCHKSQLDDVEGIRERLAARAAETASAAGMPEGRLAEGFRKVTTA